VRDLRAASIILLSAYGLLGSTIILSGLSRAAFGGGLLGLLRDASFATLKARVAEKCKAAGLPENAVEVLSFSLTNIDFSDEFENAVEAKVTAVQAAEQEKNKTVQIEEQAKQRIITAKAEAESMEIRNRALATNTAPVRSCAEVGSQAAGADARRRTDSVRQHREVIQKVPPKGEQEDHQSKR
jgi:regulator of protease activity HflC (stomatin/prohibitin superfamily)